MFDCPPDATCLREAVVHVASYHANRDKDYNERNTGLGLRFGKSKDDWFWTVGRYRNSLYRTSRYAGMGMGKDYGPVSFKLIAGVVTGYQTPLAPALIPEVGLHFGRLGIAVNYLPPLKFDGLAVSQVFGFSLTMRF